MLNMLQTNHSQIEESQLSLARLSQSRDIRAVELDRLHTDYTVPILIVIPVSCTD